MSATPIYKLKWFAVDEKGHLIGGTLRTFRFKKGRWNYLPGHNPTQPRPLKLCAHGFHAIDGFHINSFATSNPLRRGSHQELWLVAVRGGGPSDLAKSVWRAVRPIRRIATGAEWSTLYSKLLEQAKQLKPQASYSWRTQDGDIKFKVGVLVVNEIETALRKAVERQVLYHLWGPTYGPNSHVQARKQLGVPTYL